MSAHVNSRLRRWCVGPWLQSGGAVLSILLLGLASGDARAQRPPNEYERAYTAMALDMDDRALCAKISPLARIRSLFNSTQIYFERSRCFLYVASKTLNAYLCREVREASAWFHNGSYFSRANCESLIAEGRRLDFGLSFDHEPILRALDYTDEEVQQRFANDPEVNSWMLFYRDFFRRGDGELQHRLARLPNFSANR